jgi:hypothetical protein
MTDPELERLASLWREPDPAEQAVFERMARKARLQARLTARSDIALAIATAILLSLALWRHPNPVAIALGLVLYAAMLWLNWKRRALRRMDALDGSAGRQAFLDSAIGSARLKLRNIRLSYYAAIPFLLLGSLFLMTAREAMGIEAAIAYFPAWVATRRGLGFVAMFALVAVWLLYVRRRIRKEIARLETLKRAYEEEAGLDGD